jgi:L-alanine-DL-glutamate epimerase-like enolase superfamily enzyme
MPAGKTRGRRTDHAEGHDEGVRDTLMTARGATADREAPLAEGPYSAAVRSHTTHVSPSVEGLEATVYEIPTEQPESDGTLEWDSTTIVVVEAFNGRERGVGYTYGDRAAATLIESKLGDIVRGADAMRPPAVWAEMRHELRNAGQAGLGSMAISAVDIALWDLKARLLGVSLADALPRIHDSVPTYGSGGFTSYDEPELRRQLRGWVDSGIRSVKMKVGRDPEADPARVAAARDEIGPNAELMVDANGAYSLPQALGLAERFAEQQVNWLEEPLSSDDIEGLAELRSRMPAGMAIAAGEYIWSSLDAQRLLEAGAVDVLQADVTRCGGITELLHIGGLCGANQVPFSAHGAPAVSAHACCAVETVDHIEYFHDHARIESMLFDGAPEPEDGELRPVESRAGLGLEPRRSVLEEYRV